MKPLKKNNIDKSSYYYEILDETIQKYLYSDKLIPVMPYIIYSGGVIEKFIDLNNKKIIFKDKYDLEYKIIKTKTINAIFKNILPKIQVKNKEKIFNRIEYILDDVEDDKYFLQSLKSFILFLNKKPDLSSPSIGLNGDSRIQCEWEKNEHSIIILFKSNNMVEYAYMNRPKGREESWNTGYETIDEFIDTIINNKKYIELLND